MIDIVVDASVAVKWFVPEVHAPEARRWRTLPASLHVPASLFDIEIANVLWKKVQRGEIGSTDAGLILGQLAPLPVTRHSEASLLAQAFALADTTKRTVYDCIYLSLAIHLGGRMVTADLRLFNSLAATPRSSAICWVADLPSTP